MEMQNNTTIICGHRGGGGDAQSVEALTAGADWSTLGRSPDHYDYRKVWENRLLTFEYMMRQGITCFELDLLPSSNGDAMIIHDSCIEERPICQWTTRALMERGYSTLDTLMNTIDMFQSHHQKTITLLLELKGSVSSETQTDTGDTGVTTQSQRLVERVLSIIRGYIDRGWKYDQLPLIGFNHEMLKMAKKSDSSILIGLSYTHDAIQHNPVSECIAKSHDMDAYAINPDDRIIDEKYIDALHMAGLKVQSWTGYKIPSRPEAMMKWGVDTLITDCPLEALQLKRRLPFLHQLDSNGSNI